MESPGHSTASSASADQVVASPLAMKAPARPPGIRNGLGWRGRSRRSRINAGNTTRLARINSEIDSDSTTLKYLPLSSPATAKAASAVVVATSPPRSVAATGIPRGDTRAREAGPMPSRLAAACVREAPMIQVSALAISTQMKAAAASASIGRAQPP